MTRLSRRHVWLGLLATLVMMIGPATIASADHTVVYWSATTSPPNFLFSGNWSQTDNSVLNMYVTVSEPTDRSECANTPSP